MPQFLGNLTEEEFKQCRTLYEKSTGRFWIPSTVKEQDLWILAFEQAKEHFNDQRN